MDKQVNIRRSVGALGSVRKGSAVAHRVRLVAQPGRSVHGVVHGLDPTDRARRFPQLGHRKRHAGTGGTDHLHISAAEREGLLLGNDEDA